MTEGPSRAEYEALRDEVIRLRETLYLLLNNANRRSGVGAGLQIGQAFVPFQDVVESGHDATNLGTGLTDALPESESKRMVLRAHNVSGYTENQRVMLLVRLPSGDLYPMFLKPIFNTDHDPSGGTYSATLVPLLGY